MIPHSTDIFTPWQRFSFQFIVFLCMGYSNETWRYLNIFSINKQTHGLNTRTEYK